MRPTARGVAVAVLVAAGVAMAARFGARSLDAVVLPALVALVAAVPQVLWAPEPTVRRRVPDDGFPGETGLVELSFDTERPFTGTVTDTLPAGIGGDPSIATTVGSAPVSYRVTYRDRGEHEIGPARFVARDVLGLLQRSFAGGGTDRVLVYPPVRELSPSARAALVGLHEGADQREEFGRLREYVRGDSMRDVHWKSTAKRDQLIVKELDAQSGAARVRVAAGADPGAADEMAEAAASLAVALLARGVPVELSTPTGSVTAGAGDRVAVLEHLARADAGPVPEDGADVVVHAAETTRVDLGDRETTFDRLADGEEAPVAAATDGDRGEDPIGAAGDAADPIERAP